MVPYLVAVNPVGTAPGNGLHPAGRGRRGPRGHRPTATRLLCPAIRHPYDRGSLRERPGRRAGAPNFNLQPPAAAYDPLQLSALAHQGVFKGKNVGLFAGAATDETELHVVETALKSLRVPVLQSAVDERRRATRQHPISRSHHRPAVPGGRSERGGCGGYGGNVWPESFENDQSPYDPAWVATNEGRSPTAVSGSSIDTDLSEEPRDHQSGSLQVSDLAVPAVQQCYRIVRKAYPSDTITPPSNSADWFGSDLLRRGVRVHQRRALDGHSQGSGEEPHPFEFRTGWLQVAEHPYPRIGYTDLVRIGPALSDRRGVPGDLRLIEARTGVFNLSGWEVTVLATRSQCRRSSVAGWTKHRPSRGRGSNRHKAPSRAGVGRLKRRTVDLAVGVPPPGGAE